MIVVADPGRAESVMRRLQDEGETPVRIGEVVAEPSGERVRTTGRLALRAPA